MSFSCLRGFKSLKPQKDLGHSHFHGSPPHLAPGTAPCVLQGNSLSFPSPTPPSSLHIPVCIQRVPARVRKAKDPTKLFSLFSFQKNGPIHSCNLWENFLSGRLKTAKSGKQPPAREGSVVTGPNNNNKKATTATATTSTKHATCARAQTTRPQTQPQGTGLAGSASGTHMRAARRVPWPRATAAPLPAPLPSVISRLPTVSVPTPYTEADK